jgi:hypothetical protein
MGLFNRKKKNNNTNNEVSLRARPAIQPVEDTSAALEEQIAVLAAAAAVQADDITAVISAAVAAYEADAYGGTINGIPAAHVAAITAAIAEIDSGDTTGDRYEKYDHAVPKRPEGWQGLYVQRIRRVSKSLPAWGVAGNREVIDSRRM